MTCAAAAVEEVLLVLKVAFLVLLYLFLWRIVRTAARDLRPGEESMVLPAPRHGRSRSPSFAGRLVAVSGPSGDGRALLLDSAPATVGRGPDNDMPLQEDEFVSLLHARLEPRSDGIWIEDAGSTNGTYVNGRRLTRPRRLEPGDVVRVGETELRYER